MAVNGLTSYSIPVSIIFYLEPLEKWCLHSKKYIQAKQNINLRICVYVYGIFFLGFTLQSTNTGAVLLLQHRGLSLGAGALMSMVT